MTPEQLRSTIRHWLGHDISDDDVNELTRRVVSRDQLDDPYRATIQFSAITSPADTAGLCAGISALSQRIPSAVCMFAFRHHSPSGHRARPGVLDVATRIELAAVSSKSQRSCVQRRFGGRVPGCRQTASFHRRTGLGPSQNL